MVNGVNFIGMPFGMHGLGQCMRDQLSGMVKTNVPLAIVETNYSSLKSTVEAPEFAQFMQPEPVYNVNVICLNPTMLTLLERNHPEFLQDRYNIIQPYWEFPEMPQHHVNGLNIADEIWVPCQFLTDVYQSYVELPVVKMPLFLNAIEGGGSPGVQKSKDILTFGYSFDCNSIVHRKDPAALIGAFLDAFGDNPEAPVELILKYKYQPANYVDPKHVENFIELAALDDRIHLVNERLSYEELMDLFDRFDVYVSTHRSEGLGRGIIETMMRGKFIIATNYSAPAEFLDPRYTYPVDSFECRVGDSAVGDIHADYAWHMVSHDALVEALKFAADNPDEVRKRGLLAQQEIRKICSPDLWAQKAVERLKQIQL